MSDIENEQKPWLFDPGYTIVYYPGIRFPTPGIKSKPYILVVLEHDKKNNMYHFDNGLYGYKTEIESNSDALADFYDSLINEHKKYNEHKKDNNIIDIKIGGKTVRRRGKKNGKSRRRR